MTRHDELRLSLLCTALTTALRHQHHRVKLVWQTLLAVACNRRFTRQLLNTLSHHRLLLKQQFDLLAGEVDLECLIDRRDGTLLRTALAALVHSGVIPHANVSAEDSRKDTQLLAAGRFLFISRRWNLRRPISSARWGSDCHMLGISPSFALPDGQNLHA